MAKALDKSSLYDTDYVAWLDEQARHLRAGRLHALDIENVARELESLMKTERRELRSRLETLILHLLEWDHQPEQRSNRWRATVAEQRRRIRDLLLDSPSLRQEVGPICQAVYQDAVQQAAVETLLSARVFSSDLPCSVEQIFQRELPADELPTNDRPEGSPDDRAPDLDRAPAPERQRRDRAHRPAAEHGRPR